MDTLKHSKHSSGTRRSYGIVLAMAGVFALSRWMYFILGVRFIDPHASFWQFLDEDLLEHDLLRSVYYLHSQPPAFNLFTGAVLKLAPVHGAQMFHACFFALGFILYVYSFAAMRRVGVSRKVAFVVSTAFIVGPPAILYENFMFYSLPVATMLVASVLALHDLIEERRLRRAFLFFGLLALLCCTQSMFHLVYFLMILLGTILAFPKERRRILFAAAIPGLLVLGLYVKNMELFGFFGSSSWMGMNLARVALVDVASGKRGSLVEAGRMSPVALVAPFRSLDEYPSSYSKVDGFDGVPALRETKKANGGTNFNHVAYVGISKAYLRDSEYEILHEPAVYLRQVGRSWLTYAKATSEFGRFGDNLSRIGKVDRLYGRVFYGRFGLQSPSFCGVPGPWGEPFQVYPVLLVGLPALMLFGLRRVFVSRREEPLVDSSRKQRLLILYLCFNVGYVAVVGNFLESGENNRFRFATDPLSLVLFGLALETLATRFSRWRLRPMAEREDAVEGG